MVAFSISIVVSCVVFLLLYRASRYPDRPWLVFRTACLLSFFSMATVGLLFILPAVLQQCVVSAALAGVCALLGAPRKVVVSCCLAAALATQGWATWHGFQEWNHLARLRERHPLVSLADRLAYEPQQPAPLKAALSPGIQAELRYGDEELFWGETERALRNIHSDLAEDFVFGAGFGVSRMRFEIPRTIELPETPRLSLPTVPEDYPAEPAEDLIRAAAPGREDESPTASSLFDLHRDGRQAFLDPRSLGYAPRPKVAAGFQSHRFQRIPEAKEQDGWQITRLELVSLLRQKTPLVYASRDLPDLERLAETQTRPLTSFEAAALERLYAVEDLVASHGRNQIQMLGSLRASRKCLECHTVEYGALLGAFSYDLHRVRPLPPLGEPRAERRPGGAEKSSLVQR